MQVIEPPKTTSYKTEDGHFIKTFLISTKANEAGWQISKETGHKMVQSFIGKPFVIIPEHLSDERQKGHVFANSRDELLAAYKNHEHGIIESISEPFSYNDGSDDYFYTANIKLNDSKAAAVLIEAGANAWIPFSVSPHILGPTESDGMTAEWEGIGLALVKRGAYGPDAVVTKYCKGETDACTKSLAASKLCAKEDASLAASISSLVSLSENKDILAQVQEFNPATNQPKQEQQTQTQPIKEEKKEETVSLTKAEFEALNKQIEDNKQKDQQLSELIKENKTTKLNNIFKSVKDESLKKTLTEKYFNADVNQLNEFYQDITNHVVPSLIDEAKAQAEQDLKNKTIEENKGKSKAGSLAKEPEVPKDESKAGSIVPKLHNEVKRFEQLMRGGI